MLLGPLSMQKDFSFIRTCKTKPDILTKYKQNYQMNKI